ncbi:sex comb on midleg-like protein 1 isoform X2 [Physeter macrocephalus]|uniref:Sex comb on midleg-like protein 1 n=1 Tax=Physeter macrocephalus TaxID=9755 RepID=A0A2Y9S4D5_PHYMC|nr:sex comb on midleg-like protein 1 isoform X2 [Physeter catodon]|eukprot:XP_023971025.1 sex comb on midleg-like protein 1 isoform X2 [Physeter catodon]
MSSCSSEIDVIRTRIPAYDDDNTVLYAYEPNTAYFNNASVMSNTSYNEEQQKTVLDVLTHCQVIYDAIQNLDKKFDVIHGKVTKIHRFCVKSLWQNRKPLGYAYKNYSYLLSRKIRYQKMRKKEPSSPFSYPESYSPTVPVRRPENDSQSDPVGTSFQSRASPKQEPGLSQSPKLPSVFTHSYQQYYGPKCPMQGSSSMPCFHSPAAHSTCSHCLATPSAAAEPATMLTQGERSPAHNPDMMVYPASLENSRFSHAGSPLYNPTSYSPTSPVRNDPGDFTRTFPDDPSTWSVDEVILFLEHVDPQMSSVLPRLFRQHDIDGKALLLLKSDMMMKYMGLKLGTAVKLCHYIERLTKDGYFGFKCVD